MNTYNNSKVLLIRDFVSVNLALRDSANMFFDYLENLPDNKINVDFIGVVSITRSFAHQYTQRKLASYKNITNVNVPDNIQKMFDIVNNFSVKNLVLDTNSVKVASI